MAIFIDPKNNNYQNGTLNMKNISGLVAEIPGSDKAMAFGKDIGKKIGEKLDDTFDILFRNR